MHNNFTNWYSVGYNDGRYAINKHEWDYFSERKAEYSQGLIAGGRQRKEDKLQSLLEKQCEDT